MTDLLLRAVVDPTEEVGGESQSDLSAKWWQVAFGLPSNPDPEKDTNPLTDFTGEDAVQRGTLAQDGKLLYLFGTFEGDTLFVTTRDVTLPQGVEYLFGPLINIENGPDEIARNFEEIDIDSITNEAIRTYVQDIANTALDENGGNLFIEVNGSQVDNPEDFRQPFLDIERDEGFSYTAPGDPDDPENPENPRNAFGFPPGDYDRIFADGYYVAYDVSAIPSFVDGITLRQGGAFHSSAVPEVDDDNILKPVYDFDRDGFGLPDEFEGKFPQDVTYNLKFDLNRITDDDNGDDDNGDDDDDVLLGTNKRDLIVVEDDGDGDDDDDGYTLIGLKNNDNLRGGNAPDTLNGTKPGSDHPGRGEIDILFGGKGRDKFVLGHGSKTYYLGEGHNDYAIIEDFQDNDKIKLGSDEFDLRDDLTLGGERGTAISVGGDLVAFLVDVHPNDISNDIFI